MDTNTSHETQNRPQILREFEFFGGCIRVKISVTNTSKLVIGEAALELENDENILHCDRCEPEYPEKKGKIQLGNINPGTDRTIAFYLDPLICAKEGTDINCRIFYKDAYGRSEMVQMEPLKIKVICPIFRTEQEINIGRLKELIAELRFHDSKVYMFPKKVELQEILRSCRDVIQLHDVRHIKTFKTTDEKTFESWYFGKTKVTRKDLIIKCAIRRETETIEVLASGNDPGDITGLLAEIGRNLTKGFEKLGKAQSVFNISIKDSVIQRSNLLSFCDLDGSCGGNVVIEDSVVQRSEIGSGNETRFLEERERRKREKEEQAQREKEDEERQRMEEKQKLKNEDERRRIEEEQRREKQEKYEAFLLKQKKEEEERKSREEGERIAEAERREKEKQRAIQEEERQRRQREEAARIQREHEKEHARIEHEEKSSGGKWFFGLIIILAVLALGWYGTQDSNNSATPQKTIPSVTTTPVTTTPVTTAKATPPAAALVTSLADQKTYTNSIGMDFVLMPAGEFDMGSPSSEAGRDSDESPVHQVKISNAFYMGKYEVTQKQWRDVMGSSPSNFKGDNLPVEQVSWNDAQEFIKKLNEKEGVNKYRLPTEAEWEYSARAGTTTRYSFGDEEAKLGDYAWYDANSGSKTHDVGQKKPNLWGLYDMHGNVWEWVQDMYHNSYSGAHIDGSAWEGSGSRRVVRGGDWGDNARSCRSAYRSHGDPDARDYSHGFRLLRIL